MISIKNIINSQDYQKVKSVFFFKYILIPLAWPFTWLFVNLGFSPNNITYLRIVIIIFAYYLILINFGFIGFILLYLSLILDCTDGQIARVTNTATYFGKYLDGLIDSLFDFFFPIVVAYYLFQQTSEEKVFVLALTASLFNSLYWMVIQRYSLYKRFSSKAVPIKKFNSISSYLNNRLTIDIFDIKYFIFPFFLYFNYLEIFLKIMLFINFVVFIIYLIQRSINIYYLINISKKSSSHKDFKV